MTVSGCRPCRKSAGTPVMSMLGHTTLADVSGPRAAPVPARWSRHRASSWSAPAATSCPGSRGTRVKRSAAPHVWFSDCGGMCWCTQTPRPPVRPLSADTTSGSPQPAGSDAGSGSSGSMAFQRRPTARLMSRTASRTTQGMDYLPQGAAGAVPSRCTLPSGKSCLTGIAAKPAAAGPHRASLGVVLVVAAPPEAAPGLVTAERCPVEPLVHAPQRVNPARVRGVGMVDGAVLEGERAHPRPFAAVGLPVGADDRLGEGVKRVPLRGAGRPQVLLAEVVADGARLPLLLGVRHAEVDVEVAAVGGRPREGP